MSLAKIRARGIFERERAKALKQEAKTIRARIKASKIKKKKSFRSFKIGKRRWF